jgi:hypothetical protein
MNWKTYHKSVVGMLTSLSVILVVYTAYVVLTH